VVSSSSMLPCIGQLLTWMLTPSAAQLKRTVKNFKEELAGQQKRLEQEQQQVCNCARMHAARRHHA
jgi:hypothetical protein